jgi:two-component system cell cycle sensor histidine kinase/response regulator CckA
MAANVTEREGHRAEHRSWELDARFQQLVELAPDAILVHDDGRIVLANAAAVRLAGATDRAQLLGLPVDTFLDPPYLKAVQAQLTDLVSPATLAPPVRDTFRRLDGSPVQVEVRAVAFMDRGHPAAHLVIRDITDRLAAEQAAREIAERLQQAETMEAIGLLAGGVAHEVNNMMTVILGVSGFMRQDVHLPEERLADIREVMKAANRATLVTRDLLAFGRRAAHRPRSVELGDFVRQTEPMVRRLLGDGLVLAMEVNAASPVWVDPGQLEQVIINLVLNARDEMPAGGTLTLATAETDLPRSIAAVGGAGIPAGRYAILLVRDTGIGMDVATQARIFEPFFTTKPMNRGTGLGLAATYGIVTQNNGYITVSSTPGQGAAFMVYLPALPAANMVEHGGEETPRVPMDMRHAGLTVLVVDDEPAVRAITARSLESGDFRVLQAADGADALELVARDGPPHLVLTDVLMPRIGGVELARRLKERWPTLPILFMSGYSAEELGRRGLTAEGELIQKPFTQEELVRSVSVAISRVEVH